MNYNFDTKLETKKKEKLEESPYSIFGDNTAVLQTKHEEKKDHALKIPILENDNQIGLFKMDFQTGIISMEDIEGNVLEKKKLTKEQLARFTTMDPMAEKYYSISPYVYGLNNPMRYIDPDGMVARDSVTNEIVFLPEKSDVLWVGGFDGTAETKGVGGSIIANNGQKYGVLKTTHYKGYDGKWYTINTKEEMNEYGTNCAGSISLDGKFLPIDPVSYQNFLVADGYTRIPATEIKSLEIGDITSFEGASHVEKIVGKEKGIGALIKSHWAGDPSGGIVGNLDEVKAYRSDMMGDWVNTTKARDIDIFRPKLGLVDIKVNAAKYKSKTR